MLIIQVVRLRAYVVPYRSFSPAGIPFINNFLRYFYAQMYSELHEMLHFLFKV